MRKLKQILNFILYPYYWIRKKFRIKKIKQTELEKQVEQYHESQKEKMKEMKYPLFIPFYEYSGFIKGLQYENRMYFLTGGKKGIKPKKWK